MLTRSEFRQLFGLPKKRRTLIKKSSSKVHKKTSRKTAPKTASKVGKRVVRKTSTKLGKKVVAGKLRTIYKSKNGSKYYKKVSNGKVYRAYLGKPVLRKVPRKTPTARFGYQNTSSRSLSGLMGPSDLSGNSVNVVAKKAPAAAAFGKRSRRNTRFGYVSGSARNLTGMMGPFPLSAANGSAIPTSFGKKSRVAAKKPASKTAAKKTAAAKKTTTKVGKKVAPAKKPLRKKTTTKAGKKVVRRSSRFGLMHGRPSKLASAPYPF